MLFVKGLKDAARTRTSCSTLDAYSEISTGGRHLQKNQLESKVVKSSDTIITSPILVQQQHSYLIKEKVPLQLESESRPLPRQPTYTTVPKRKPSRCSPACPRVKKLSYLKRALRMFNRWLKKKCDNQISVFQNTYIHMLQYWYIELVFIRFFFMYSVYIFIDIDSIDNIGGGGLPVSLTSSCLNYW